MAEYARGNSGNRKQRREREREVKALSDLIKLHVLACLWQQVYAELKAQEGSITGSLARGTLRLLESNLSVAAGKAFTQWSVVPVEKYVRQLRDGIRLEEACMGDVGAKAGTSAPHAKLEEETERFHCKDGCDPVNDIEKTQS